MNGTDRTLHYADEAGLPSPTPDSPSVSFSGWSDGYALYTDRYIMPLRDVILTEIWATVMTQESIVTSYSDLSCTTDANAVNLSAEIMRNAASELTGNRRLTVRMDKGSIAFDSEFISSVSGNLNLSMTKVTEFNSSQIAEVAENGVLINLGLSDDRGEIHSFAGRARAAIETLSDWSASTIALWYLNESNNKAKKVEAAVVMIEGEKFAVADWNTSRCTSSKETAIHKTAPARS